MDTDQKNEQQAFDLYDKGDYGAARALFERLAQSPDPEFVHSHNASCCQAAEGDTLTALNKLLMHDGTQSSRCQDAQTLHNIALCLLSLNEPLVALAIVDKIGHSGRSPERQQQRINSSLAKLLLHCMSQLGRTRLSRTQCKQLERLMIRHKADMLKLMDGDSGELIWRKNLAHVLFALDSRYGECADLFESIVSEHQGRSLLSLEPEVLSGLCLSCILTRRNREAVALLKRVERESTASALSTSASAGPRPPAGPLVLMNLAMATWYCVENNYDQGLGKIFKSLEPLDEKLNSATWAQAKRCILSALDKHCKRSIHIEDNLADQTLSFLMDCEANGALIVAQPHKGPPYDGCNSVTYEARLLRSILLALVHE